MQADLQRPGSFDEAVQGCDYVIHTASPVVMFCRPGEEHRTIIAPALAGVENVLGAVERAPSVQRVVLTSSSCEARQ